MDGFAVAWLLWGLAFVAIEVVALVRKAPGDTLSEHVREWAGVTGKGPAVKVRRLGLLAFLAWLSVHLLTDGFV